MRYNKYKQLHHLKALLDKEQDVISADQKRAVELQQWEYATELQHIKMHLQEFLEHLRPLQPKLV